MRKRIFGRCISVFLAGASSAFLLAAQEMPPRKKTLQHEAAAVIKLIPVRVLDADGRPVKGLEKADFILYDNDRRRTITEFEVHETGGRLLSRQEIASAAQPDTGARTSRKYFILLDIQGSDANGMVNAKQAALEFVETRVRTGDEVGVFSFAPMTGLKIQQYLTSDPDKIRKGIERAKEAPPTRGFISGNEFDDSVRAGGARGRAAAQAGGGGTGIAGGTVPPGNIGQGTLLVAVPGLGIFGRKSVDFTASMSELAEAVKYIPGSKNLAFFSSRNPGSNVARLFAAANAPVYAVNTKNWIVHGIINRSIKKKHVYHEHPLKDFAEASGGSYFADIEDVETIAEEINLLSGNYYVLGYYVDEKWDGRFNRIKIEVRRSDVRVLAQDGYFNPKPFAELTEIEKKLHFYDLAFADPPASSPLDLQIEAFCSRVPEKANVMVLTRLQVNEHLGVPPAEAEVFILILAEDQQILSAERGDLDLSTCDGRTFFSYVTKNLKPGAYECRVVIRELAMGRSLVGRAAFSVPSPGGMALSTPLLLRPDAGAEFLRFSIGKKKADAVSLLHFFPYLPRNSTPLLGEIERDTRGLWLLVPISRKSGGSADLDLDLGLIRDSEAGTIPLDWSVIDVKRARPGTDFYLVGITLPSLSPGDYRLKVTAGAAETGERASVSMFLTIR